MPIDDSIDDPVDEPVDKPVDILLGMKYFAKRYSEDNQIRQDISIDTLTNWMFEVQRLRSEIKLMEKVIKHYERLDEQK